MYFINDFNRAMEVSEYKKLLGDQESVHDLHYKKAELPEIIKLLKPLKMLVITEPWCGDSTAILPVILKFFESQPVKIRIALRDKNPELMEQFLTKGGRAIPIF